MVRKKIVLILFLSIFFGGISFAQNSNYLFEAPQPVFSLVDGTFTGLVDRMFRLPEKLNFLSFSNPPQVSLEKNNSLYYFHYEIAKGAIFCRMENHLRNTFNIWIKIRAGTDESYNEIKPQ